MTATLKAGLSTLLPWRLSATELAAGTGFEIYAPRAGWLNEIQCVTQVAIVTGGAITVLTGAALATTVLGLGLTIPDASAKGDRRADTATAGSSTRYVAKGDRIAVVPGAAFNGGGALDGFLVLDDMDTSPALPAV